MENVFGSDSNWLTYKDGARPIYFRILLDGAQTANKVSMIEQKIPAGFSGPGSHVHQSFVQTIQVAKGKIVVSFGRKGGEKDSNVLVLEAGSFFIAPPGVPHDFWNPFDEEARITSTQTPAGLESMFKEWSRIDQTLDENDYRKQMQEISDIHDNKAAN